MQVEMRDNDTMALKPESTAEMSYLRQFVGGVVEVEKPPPFTMNVEVLLIKRPGESDESAQPQSS